MNRAPGEVSMPQPASREESAQLDGSGRQVYTAAVFALTEPGPAAAGLVVTDRRGRALAHRAQYLGRARRDRAAAQALLIAARFAAAQGLERPVFRIDDSELLEALRGAPSENEPAPLPELRETLAQLAGCRFEAVNPASNPARSVAAAPLLDWLPERTRRAEELRVRRLDDETFEVESESRPGQRYRVRLPSSDDESATAACECADFQYREIPCKHLLAAAREVGSTEQLFYPSQPETSRP